MAYVRCLLVAAGHSLGGALATLAAYDLRKRLQAGGRPEVEVLCYTFGAPRTGNHAFATDYNHVVPDTWSIINDQASLAAAVPATLCTTDSLCKSGTLHTTGWHADVKCEVVRRHKHCTIWQLACRVNQISATHLTGNVHFLSCRMW